MRNRQQNSSSAAIFESPNRKCSPERPQVVGTTWKSYPRFIPVDSNAPLDIVDMKHAAETHFVGWMY